STDPQMPTGLTAGPTSTAPRAAKPRRPTRSEQVIAARLLSRETLSELQDAERIRRPRHPTKLRNPPDGANRIRITNEVLEHPKSLLTPADDTLYPTATQESHPLPLPWSC